MIKWFVITLSSFNQAFLKKAIMRGCRRVHLDKNLVGVYCPIIRRFFDEQLIEEPLYEGYSFISLPEDIDAFAFFLEFADPVHFIGVLKEVVCIEVGGKKIDITVPKSVDENIIKIAQERCERPFIKKESLGEDLHGGDRVVILKGTFKGFEGDIVHIEKHRREAFLEIFFLGMCVQVQVKKIDLEKLNK